MSICKFCGTEIDWIQTVDGQYIPIDVDPVFVIEGKGTEQFIEDTGTAMIGRLARPEEESSDLPVAFIPHIRTCGNNWLQRMLISSVTNRFALSKYYGTLSA